MELLELQLKPSKLFAPFTHNIYFVLPHSVTQFESVFELFAVMNLLQPNHRWQAAWWIIPIGKYSHNYHISKTSNKSIQLLQVIYEFFLNYHYMGKHNYIHHHKELNCYGVSVGYQKNLYVLLLISDHTVFVQFCASTTTTTCSIMGSASDNKGDQQIHTSSIYFDLDHPAKCNGYISQLHYCYYATSFAGFVRDNPVHQAIIQIWRENLNTGELYWVQEYELSQDTSQDDRDDFVCRNVTLKQSDYISIEENDVIGVTLPLIHTLMPPLQLISTNTTGFGLYFEPLSSSSIKTVKVSSLMLHKELVLHLSADISEF